MDWKFTVVGLLTGLLVGMTGHGRRLADDPDPRLPVRHSAVDGDRHRHRPRRRVQVRQRGAAPADGERSGEARRLDAHRIGARCRCSASGSTCSSRSATATTWSRCSGRCSAPRCSSARSGSWPRASSTPGASGDPNWKLTNRDRVAAVLIGVLGGFIVGLTSVGSGVFFGLTLLVLFPLRAHKVVGTDIFHAAVLLYVAGAAHWAAGNVDFGLLFWLLLGSIPGVLIGGRLTLAIPEQFLRLLLAGVLGLAGIKLLDVPGRWSDRRRRALGGTCRASRLPRAAQLDPHPARSRHGCAVRGGIAR